MIRLDALYEESELEAHLAGSFRPLVDARKAKKVEHVSAHGSTFYQGQWVADWLEGLGKVDAEPDPASKATKAKPSPLAAPATPAAPDPVKA